MQAGTILIVDDNKSVLTSLELLLEDEFEGVETASNPNSILCFGKMMWMLSCWI